jgi:DNA-binding NarL/FixJ family response regulator
MSSTVKSIRVLLADDHPIVRKGIRAELELMPGVAVVGEVSDGRQALELVGALQPDVVFMDISMPGLNGLEAATRITKEFPQVRVIILSMHHNEEYVWRALKAGATGYLLKQAAIAEMGAALRRVTGGQIYLSRDISARFIGKFPTQEVGGRSGPFEKLTDRQREVLQLIAEGQNTKQIAAILKISPKTVEYHRMKLMDTLSIHDIPGLVRFALRVGLLPPEG